MRRLFAKDDAASRLALGEGVADLAIRLLPVVIALVALAVRLLWLDRQGLWGDEGYTWQEVRGSLPEMFDRLHVDGTQVPLYFTALWFWSRAFGVSEFGLRSFSAVAGAAGVFLVWFVARHLLGRRGGLLAAALAAVSPLAVYYSQEARPYSLAFGLTTGAVACALRGFEGGGARRGWLVAYALCAAGAAITHYFAFFAILATVLAVPRSRDALRAWLAATAAAGLPLLAWVAVGWASFGDAISSGGVRGQPVGVYLIGVGEAFAKGLPSPNGLPVGTMVLGIAVALIGVRGRGGLLLAAWFVMVLAAVELVGFPSDRPGPWVRYVFPALPAFILLQGTGVERLWRRRSVLGAVALVALLGVSVYSVERVYRDPALARYDFRGPVRKLAATVTPQDRVIVNQGNPAFFYYYSDAQPAPIVVVGHAPGLSQEQVRQLVAKAPRAGANLLLKAADEIPQTMSEVTAGARRVYLVKYMPPDFDPGDGIERWLNEHATKLSDEWVEHIRLLSYDLTPEVAFDDPAVKPLDVRFGDGIELVGWTVPADVRGGELTKVTLFWRGAKPVAARYKVFVHVLAGGDPAQKVTQHDSEPGLGTAPTTGWKAGEVVRDTHPLTLSAGDWVLSVGMYEPESGKRLPVHISGAPADSQVMLGPVRVR